MQVILITPSGRNMLTLRLNGWRLWLAAGLLGLMLLATVRTTLALSSSPSTMVDRLMQWWEATRDDAMARELGSLKAKIELLESTVSAMDGDTVTAPAKPLPASEPRPPRLEELEVRAHKISLAIDDVLTTRQHQLERMAGGAAAKPIEAAISSPFGTRADPFDGNPAFHRGIDFLAPTGTPIFAIGDGVVQFIGAVPGYGKLVEIRHSPRLVSRYAHLDGIEVTTGMPLQAGQRIARVGATGRATGAHLHFELHLDGKAVNPKPYLAHLYRAPRLTENEPQQAVRRL